MWQKDVGAGEAADAAIAANGRDDSTRSRIVPPVLWRLFVLAWLPFLFYPLHDALLASNSVLHLAITLAGAALLVGLYLGLVLPLPFSMVEMPPRRAQNTGRRWLALVVLLALLAAAALSLTLFSSVDWLWFCIFASIAFGVRLPPRIAVCAIAALLPLVVLAGWQALGWVYAFRIALPVAVVGLGMVGVGWLVAMVRALRAAREEIARLAIAEERLRFARDLHDLLGHSLSTITLKNELARTLVLTQPERAVAELGEAIGLAREALREVRATVSGYRQPALAVEISSARTLLDAAGIACHVDGDAGSASPLPPPVEAVLGWAVREGVTNVVRYSGAATCSITVSRAPDAVAVEIADDGRGMASHAPERDIPGRTGTGLAGLAERAAQVRARMEAGPREPSGFRLWLEVPLPVAGTPDIDTAHSAAEKVRQP